MEALFHLKKIKKKEEEDLFRRCMGACLVN
jgi:hypothetical protein